MGRQILQQQQPPQFQQQVMSGGTMMSNMQPNPQQQQQMGQQQGGQDPLRNMQDSVCANKQTKMCLCKDISFESPVVPNNKWTKTLDDMLDKNVSCRLVFLFHKYYF